MTIIVPANEAKSRAAGIRKMFRCKVKSKKRNDGKVTLTLSL